VTPITAQGQPRSFTTAGVPPDQRIEQWQAHNSQALMGLHCRALVDAEFAGSTVNVELARVHLARVNAMTAHVIERRSDLIRRHPENSIVLFFVLAGDSFFYHSDGVRTLRPGQLIACDADQPFMRGFSNGFAELVLKVPRRVFLERTGLERLDAPLFTGFADDQNPVARRLVELVGSAARLTHPRAPGEDALLTLVATLLGDRDRTRPPGHLTVARTYIDSRLSDTSLSAARTASAVGVSPRHLSRVFARAGMTFPAYVLGRRLEAARAMLHGPRASSMTVAEVAGRCGFSSVAYFSRSFDARFGERPSDMRRRAIQERHV
jgi:AraC-like DNA-binding protein